ncbi:MAG: dinuclear metal center YbgI/SA1388 family protein [Planctomycetaceae bacterium]|jgi:dinuclear metal center YbgI/SA1388 family protein
MFLNKILNFLSDCAPAELSEDWDNTGLLIGQQNDPVSSIMTCLTLTPDVAEEAVSKGASLVVTHHPILFRAVQKLTDETSEGRMLLSLIRAGVAVYSPHTSYDSAYEGVNRQLADSLNLANVKPIRTIDSEASEETADELIGSGRFGDLPDAVSLKDFVELVKQALRIQNTWFVGDSSATIRRVGIACGAAAEFMGDAARHGCDVLLTGEARFHACLDARSRGIALVLPGHYPTERPAMEKLAERLSQQFPDLTVWASDVEADPVQWA